MSDHYETLGIAPNATIGEIEAAFAEISEQYHPSKYEGNELQGLAAEKLRQAQRAYAVLRDTRLRAQYDREYGFRPQESGAGLKKKVPELIKAQLPALFVRLLWVGLAAAYVRIVRNPKIILFTLGAFFLIWAIRKYRKR